MTEVERLRLPDDAAWAFGRILGRCLSVSRVYRDERTERLEEDVRDDLLVIIAAVRADERDKRDQRWVTEIMSDPIYGERGITFEGMPFPLRMHPPTLLVRALGWEWRDGAAHKIEEVRDVQA